MIAQSLRPKCKLLFHARIDAITSTTPCKRLCDWSRGEHSSNPCSVYKTPRQLTREWLFLVHGASSFLSEVLEFLNNFSMPISQTNRGLSVEWIGKGEVKDRRRPSLTYYRYTSCTNFNTFQCLPYHVVRLKFQQRTETPLLFFETYTTSPFSLLKKLDAPDLKFSISWEMLVFKSHNDSAHLHKIKLISVHHPKIYFVQTSTHYH